MGMRRAATTTEYGLVVVGISIGFLSVLMTVGDDLRDTMYAASGMQKGKNGNYDENGYPNHGTVIGTCPDACGWHGASYTATPFSPEQHSWTYPDDTPLSAHDNGWWTYDGPTWYNNEVWAPTWVYTPEMI
jgi:Flp pilus assembly pilin Flp